MSSECRVPPATWYGDFGYIVGNAPMSPALDAAVNSCTSNQPGPYPGSWVPDPAQQRCQVLWRYNGGLFGVRYKFKEGWTRPNGGPFVWTLPRLLPRSPTVYTPVIEPPPYVRPNTDTPPLNVPPARHPSRDPVSPATTPVTPGTPQGPTVSPPTRTRVRTRVRTRTRTDIRDKPWIDRGTDTRIDRTPPTKPTPPSTEVKPDVVIKPPRPPVLEPPGHTQDPPRKREREHKTKSKLASTVSTLYDAVTETGDVVDAIWKNIDPGYRKGRGMAGKLRDIYLHSDRVDWDKAIADIIRNHLTDKLIGRTIAQKNRAMRKANEKYLGRDYSWTGSKSNVVLRIGNW